MINLEITDLPFKKVIFNEADVEERLPQEILDFIYEIPAGKQKIVLNFWLNGCLISAIGHVTLNRFLAFIDSEKKAPIADRLKLMQWYGEIERVDENGIRIFDLEFSNPIQTHLNDYRKILELWLNSGYSDMTDVLALEDCRKYKISLLKFWGGGHPQFTKFITWLSEYDQNIKRLLDKLEAAKRGW